MRVLAKVMENDAIGVVIFELQEISITTKFEIVANEDTINETVHEFTAPYVLQMKDMEGNYIYIPCQGNPKEEYIIPLLKEGYVDLRRLGMCVYAPDETDLEFIRTGSLWGGCHWEETVVAKYGDME